MISVRGRFFVGARLRVTGDFSNLLHCTSGAQCSVFVMSHYDEKKFYSDGVGFVYCALIVF